MMQAIEHEQRLNYLQNALFREKFRTKVEKLGISWEKSYLRFFVQFRECKINLVYNFSFCALKKFVQKHIHEISGSLHMQY